VDYEHLTAPLPPPTTSVPVHTGVQEGKRLIYFSHLAGVLGTLFSLHTLGLTFLRHGVSTPLLHTPLPYTLRDMDDLKYSMSRLGRFIEKEGLGKKGKGKAVVVTVTG
jgi:hypothetical protein